jgi:carbamoylphosphate synthase large subunit
VFLIYKYGVIDRVESNNEYWLMLDSIIREQFNIPGVKSKSKMKKRFIKVKGPIAKGQTVKNIKKLEKAIVDEKIEKLSEMINYSYEKDK